MSFADPALHLRICGILLVVLALFHCVLPRRFGWRSEMQEVSLLTRQIFYVHTFFIALTVGFMGLLAFFLADELLRPTPLAKAVLGGLTLFWFCRCFFQIFVYDSALWRGKVFETRVHVIFSLLWLYLTAVFGWAFWLQFR